MKIDLTKEVMQALIVCPNRELMNQTYEVCLNLVKFINGINIAKLVDIKDTNTLLKAQLVVSTPGIAVKAFKRNVLNHETCKVVVFDEADVLLAASDRDHCTLIARNMSQVPNIQFLGFSATTTQSIIEWFDLTFNSRYNKILTGYEDLYLDGVKHLCIVLTDKTQKLSVLNTM